jgi:hypothetical protein
MSVEYCTTEQLKEYATRTGRGDDELHESIIPRASRVIDSLCQVKAGYFGVALPNAKSAVLSGSGLSRLRVPPYVCGSIQYAEYASDCDEIFPDYDEFTDEYDVQWLKARDGKYFVADATVEITARWGWACVPDDIVEATIELAMAMWRQKDAAFLRVQADINGAGGVSGAAVPDRVKMICEHWKRKRAMVFA